MIGYPRTGFTLLISVVAELRRDRLPGDAYAGKPGLKTFCDTAGTQMASGIEEVFQRRGLAQDLLYNPNFKLMVGGPKWLKDGDGETACFRKYIGVRGKGDFTLITSHPRQVLDYYDINHSHVHPAKWASHPAYADYDRFSSIRHPAGTITSACFSLNALASEYIQRFVPPEDDNDLIRQRLALYKLSDLNFFAALITPFKAYLEEFDGCADRYSIMRWEDLIQKPVATIMAIAEASGTPVDAARAADIWRRLDHVNLTGAHRHNLRRGHGIVGGWRQWLTNTHLDMLRDAGLDAYCERYAYGPLGTLDEADYTPFQKTLADYLKRGEIFREYGDQDLFGFAFNKSNLDLSRFSFQRYPWRTHTQIERSSCTDEALVMEVSDVAEAACEHINRALALLLHSPVSYANEKLELADALAKELASLFTDAGALSAWQQTMLVALGAEGRQPPQIRTEPHLLESIGTTNIVEYSGQYYALPQSLGPVDFHAQDASSLPGVLVADDLARLRARLQAGDDAGRRLSGPLLFIHIPRTGGTSLISWLDGLFDQGEICPAHEMFQFEELARTGQMNGYSLYRGHVGINFRRQLDRKLKTIVFLRQPVDRVYSTWRHLRSAARPFVDNSGVAMVQQIHSDAELAHTLGFEDFCRAVMQQGRLSFFNQMTVLLGLGRGWEIAAAGIPEVDDALFDNAMENLHSIDFVGFTETYETDFEELSLLLTNKIVSTPHLNSAPPIAPCHSAEFRDWLMHATRFDRRLYETARSRTRKGVFA